MTTTGYSDTFNRTVSGGLGTATSGQAYTLFGTASQFSVAPSTASIAVASAGDKIGYVDLQTQNVDVTAQVAINAIPATNLATVGFVAKLNTISNYYNCTMMVQTLGILSLRFSKVIGGALSTISTTLVGSYVAGTFYNLRYTIFWSNALQTNVMQAKLWAVGTTEPGGWMAASTDSALTQYTAGTGVGILGRDESTALGTITTRHQSLLVRSYSLPMPSTADTMCADPAVAFPKQTALESLADAADAAMAPFDPLADLAALFPRVRVSASNVPISGPTGSTITYAATEFNIGTPTDLGSDNAAVYLPVGIWLATFEIQLVEAASAFGQISSTGSTGPTSGWVNIGMRSNAVHLNDNGVGGTSHFSATVYSTDPTTPVRYLVNFNVGASSTVYTITYVALSAVKISDYFS